jgi:hypothetical protein
MQTNALRSLLYEFGATFAKGKRALFKDIVATLEGLAHTLPQLVRDSLHEQVARIKSRRPSNVVFVAQAAKMARTIWAITAKVQDYDRDFKSIRPQAA